MTVSATTTLPARGWRAQHDSVSVVCQTPPFRCAFRPNCRWHTHRSKCAAPDTLIPDGRTIPTTPLPRRRQEPTAANPFGGESASCAASDRRPLTFHTRPGLPAGQTGRRNLKLLARCSERFSNCVRADHAHQRSPQSAKLEANDSFRLLMACGSRNFGCLGGRRSSHAAPAGRMHPVAFLDMTSEAAQRKRTKTRCA